MTLPAFAYPGLTLATTSTHNAGPGTHVHGTHICASLAGKPTLSSPAASETTPPSTSTPGKQTLPPSSNSSRSTTTSSNNVKPTISISTSTSTSHTAPPSIPSRQISRHNTLPSMRAIVLARITRLGARQANVAICTVDGRACADDFAGVIRREDVRGWEIDRVSIDECFAVGDVVRAVVISLGDQSSYYLSTARNELGVLLATSRDGNQMYPISWRCFRDPVTGREEVRKVAKPV